MKGGLGLSTNEVGGPEADPWSVTPQDPNSGSNVLLAPVEDGNSDTPTSLELEKTKLWVCHETCLAKNGPS